MAARTRTLQQLRDGVADRGDLDVAETGVRHLWSKVDARINMAIQRWLLLQYEAGDETTLKRATVTTSTSSTRGSAGWAPKEYLVIPEGTTVVAGVDIYPNGIAQAPIAMLPVDELERNDSLAVSRWWATGASGLPVFYRKAGSLTSGVSELLLVYPWADAVYSADIYYIPALVDLDDATDTVDFVCGGEDWVINEATIKSLLSDGLGGHPNMGQMRMENQTLERELAFTMAKRGSVRKVDTFGQRRAMQRYLPRGFA